MHHSMQQRVDGLAALRARSLMATAEFYELIGRPPPAPKPLFQAVAKGKAWHIIEIATGKTKRFCFSHRAAMRFIEAMEAGTNQHFSPYRLREVPYGDGLGRARPTPAREGRAAAGRRSALEGPARD